MEPATSAAAAPVSTHRLLAFRLAALVLVAFVALAALGSVGLIRLAARDAPALTTTQVVQLVRPSVVAVTVTPFRSDPRKGSGFVFGAAGRILTSAHLVTKALTVSVMDSAGETYSAVVIGVNRETDVAELQVNVLRAKPIAPAKGAPIIGSRVLVVDNPVGFLAHDVTQGAIRATGSDLTVGTATYRNVIQTGAAATAGDTGGPLVNAAGQLVGIVIADETGHALAIPLASFAAEAKAWAASGTPMYLGPPRVTATPESLVLSSIGPGWLRTANSQWNATGWHAVWEKPHDYTYGSEAVDIYLAVEATDSDAGDRYKSSQDYVTKNGYAPVGPVAGLADQATAYQRVVSGRPSYAVIWRDRNCEVLMYLSSGRPPRREVSVASTLAIAFAQESVIGADLANYN